MAERRGKQPPETVEMTEMLVLHGESLSGSDRERENKLERIREALHERGIDFVDQPEALEIWVGTHSKPAVVEALEQLGYRTDVYEI